MAKTWSVTLPITGYVIAEVEADNEKQAIEEALNADIYSDNIEEWGVREKIIEGNVFHGIQNEAEAELIDDEEE